MKKTLIASSIAALVSGVALVGGAQAGVIHTPAANTAQPTVAAGTTATALRLAPNGVGHILFVPYFSTQNGNTTLLSLVNSDQVNGKVVKVRFRGAANSDDIFDFQVLMSPGDVWTANVSQGADGRSVLTTTDTTCTRPARISGTAFPTTRLPSSFTDAQKANATREGYIEVLNVADIPKPKFQEQGAGSIYAGVQDNPLYTATKHVGTSGVAPCTESVLSLLRNDPTIKPANGNVSTPAATLNDLNNAGFLGLGYPSGGLFANWTIVNVPNTTTFTGEATAVSAVVSTSDVPGFANIAFFPQTDDLYLGTNMDAASSGALDINFLTADPLLRKGVAAASASVAGAIYAANPLTGALEQATSSSPRIAALNFDLPDLSTPYVTVPSFSAPAIQAAELTSLLATTSITNEYLTNPVITANTDWVFSTPTRRYNVAMNYSFTSSVPGADGRTYTNLRNNAAPFTSTDVVNYFQPQNTAVSSGLICVNADTSNGFASFGQEEENQLGDFVVSPGVANRIRFCGEASVLSFNGADAQGNAQASVLSANIARQNVTTAKSDGWARIGTAGIRTSAAGESPVRSLGLPVLGASFERANNPSARSGTSGTYGAVFTHRTSTKP